VKIWFQNRRTKWKKQENLSNAEAAEHRACAEHRRSSDHRRRGSVDSTSHHHNPASIISHHPPPPPPPCNPLTVALAGGPSPAALQLPRVFVTGSPVATVTSLAAHDIAFRFPPPDAIPPPPAVTSFRPAPLLPVSRCDDVIAQRPRETTSSAAAADHVTDESADSRHDSDVITPPAAPEVPTNVDNVGSDDSMRETD